MPYRAMIFDLDGTLVDAYPGLLESLNYTLRVFGKPDVDLPRIKRMVGRGLDNLLEQALGTGYPSAAVKIFKESYQQTHLSGSALLPDVRSTLEDLSKRGIRMAVASNKPPEFTIGILRKFEIELNFEMIHGPGPGIAPKPDPFMLEAILRKMNIDREEALYIGDMPLDVQTGRAAGIAVALLPTGGALLQDLKSAEPDFIVLQFRDLLKLPALR